MVLRNCHRIYSIPILPQFQFRQLCNTRKIINQNRLYKILPKRFATSQLQAVLNDNIAMSKDNTQDQPDSKRIKLDESKSTATIAAVPNSFLKEEGVGITTYVNPNGSRFSAILKHRYSDFIVNEIDLNGNVIKLCSAGKIEDPYYVDKFAEEDQDADLSSEQKLEKADKLLTEIIGQEEAQKVVDLARSDSNSTVKQITLEKKLDKAQRTEIYGIVKRLIPGILECETIDGTLRFTHISLGVTGGQSSKRRDSRKRRDWNHGGDFVHFTMYKENKDTMEVLNKLAKVMRMKTGMFGFAGTKDKRGVTTQRCCVFKVEAARIQSAVQKLGNPKLEGATRLGDYRYEKERIKLGDLQGNRFSIALRYVEGSAQEEIEKSLASLRDSGFINYYGMQRFGTSSVPSHEIGKAVLKGDWKQVINLVLDPRVGEREEIQAARLKWKETKDPKETLKLFPKYGALAEKAIINFFIEDKNITNCASAFARIPRTMRLMYAHAYQSYIWNCAASERVNRYGVVGVVPGDLVAVIPEVATVTATATEETDSNQVKKQDDNGNDEVEAEESDTLGTGKVKYDVEVVTEETVSKYLITDVVLPLPGWDVKFPENEINKIYTEKMNADNISIDTLKNHGIKEYRLTGSYRKLLAKPSNLEWNWMRFDDGNLPLLQTDVAKMKNLPAPESVPNGKHLALCLNFDLESSSYATMLLREILASETGSAHQAAMSINLQ